MVAEVNGKTIALFNVDGTFYAIDNTCVHCGGPLGEGDVVGDVVGPWPNWGVQCENGLPASITLRPKWPCMMSRSRAAISKSGCDRAPHTTSPQHNDHVETT